MAAKPVNKTIFIGGFSSATDSQAIFTAFSPFGDIIDVQLPPDPSHQASHRGFAFVTYVDATSATDAIDNMHQNVLPGSSNLKRVLKVNLAKPSKGIAVGGSNRAIWQTEEWIKENGVAAAGSFEVGTEGGRSAQVAAMQS